MNPQWIEVCAADEIDLEDVVRFDHGEKTFAVYRTDKDEFYTTDGFCTHAQVHLADGLVMGEIIECPKHNGRFNCASGQAIRKPAIVPLKTYPTKIENGNVYIEIEL